jgi:membrane fusion protein (multidrug efflux system)
MKRILQSIIVVGLTLAITSCGSGEAEKQGGGPNALQVEAYKVVTQPFNNELITTANLMAEEQVQLMAPMAGQVLAIYFKEGESVKKGQTLVRLDDRNWKAQLLGVNAELAAAEKDYARKKELLAVEGSSQEEIDNAFSKVEILKSQQQQLQVNIDLANVSAPFSGQLGMRDFSEGAFLKQGELITTLSANNQLKVDFTIAQMHTKSIEVNKSVLVLIGNDTLEANVYAINPIINTETRMLNVRALLEQKVDKKIKPGTFAEVLIATDMINDAILIPTQAVIPSINEQTVYVAKNGKAVRKVIQMGNRNADNVLVLEGLSVGDTVITTGLLNIKEGMDLKIQSIK